MKRPLDSSRPSFSAPRDESKVSSTRLSEKTFNKKRFWLIVAILALVEAVILCLALQWKYIFPSREVSDLYTRYENVDGIAASFIKDYKVNDTVFVDVTLLETKDTALWDSLCKDFGIALFSMYTKEYKALMSIEHSFDHRLIKDTVLMGHDSVIIKDLVVFSHLKMSMCIFHHVSDTQYDAIINKEYEEITY